MSLSSNNSSERKTITGDKRRMRTSLRKKQSSMKRLESVISLIKFLRNSEKWMALRTSIFKKVWHL